MDLSIIIINYNTKFITEKCVQSFLNNRVDNKKVEIILVDNASNDGSIDYFIEKYSNNKNVRLIFNEKNYGFGNANNIAAKVAKGKYLVFANSDIYIKHLNFDKFDKIYKKVENIGALSCKVLYPDDTIQTLGFDFPSVINDIKLNIFLKNFKFHKNIKYKNYINRGLIKRDWVSGCFFICEAELFNKACGFDPEIFMYAEDLDICTRFKNLGKHNYVYDKEEVYHLHGKSTQTENLSLKKMLKYKKNYYYVIKKNNISKIPEIIFLINFIHICILYVIKKIMIYSDGEKNEDKTNKW